MKRREFITLIGGAVAAWPLAVRAQQPAMPVIGFLNGRSPQAWASFLAAFLQGLKQAGYVDGHNVVIEYRWAQDQSNRLPGLAAELVRYPVAVMVTSGGDHVVQAARAATATTPIVSTFGLDPVAHGLASSLNRPGGNATGMTLMSLPIGEKRLEMLRELAPKSSVIAMLVNPMTPDAVPEIGSVQTAAQSLGSQLRMFNASTPSEINDAFAAMAEQRPDALLVGTDPFFVDRRAELVARAAQLRVPAIYPFREFTAAGGLVSYGSNIANSYRQAGIYAGRILKGAKPADLPVMQPTTFELVINLRTASALGIEIPATLHARSDEVIE